MATHLRCGRLFTALDEQERTDHTVVFDDGVITHVGPSGEAPPAADILFDHPAGALLGLPGFGQLADFLDAARMDSLALQHNLDAVVVSRVVAAGHHDA